MKIRIQDHSIRFRLTIKETERLQRDGRLESKTELLGLFGPTGVFCYSLSIDDHVEESAVLLKSHGIEMVLCPADAETLFSPLDEGVYIRREWTDPNGETKRFIAFAEKDRPGSTCVKPEAWIYEAVHGQPVSTVPIPSRE